MERPDKLSIRKRLALRLYDSYRHNAAKIHELTYLFWEATLRCPLNCQHCGSDCRQESNVKDMPVQDFLKAVRQIVPIVNPHRTMVVCTGGEVLVRHDLAEAGRALAALDEVTHCYERPPCAEFPYNLFAMVHGTSGAEAQRQFEMLKDRLAALPEPPAASVMLLSTKEYKKTSMVFYP